MVSVLDLILLKCREVGLFFMALESERSSRDDEVDAFGRGVGEKLVACLVVPGYPTLPR